MIEDNDQAMGMRGDGGGAPADQATAGAPTQPEVITLQEFLLSNPQDNVIREVYPSSRFQGRGMPFKVRLMTSKEYSGYQRAAFRLMDGRNMRFDQERFNNLIVLNHVIEPNFKDQAFLAKAGCTTPDQLLNKVLKAGEVLALAEFIAQASGFGDDAHEVQTAKNS